MPMTAMKLTAVYMNEDLLESALFGGPLHARPAVLPMPDFAETSPAAGATLPRQAFFCRQTFFAD